MDDDKLEKLQDQWTAAVKAKDHERRQLIEAEMKKLGYEGNLNSVKDAFRKSALRASLSDADIQAAWSGYLFGVLEATRRYVTIGMRCEQIGSGAVVDEMNDLGDLLLGEVDEYMTAPKTIKIH